MAKVYNPRLRGNSPLQYLGDPSPNPPNVLEFDRAPTVNDYSGFNIGDKWIYQISPQEIFVLTNKENKVATWMRVVTGEAIIGVVGEGTLRGTAAGVIYSLADGVDLDVYMGSTGNIAEWGAITSTGTTVTITRTAAGINLEAAGGTATNTYTTDDANVVVPDGAGNVDVDGGANITTTGAVANQILISLDNDITITGDINADNGDFAGDLGVVGDVTITGDLIVDDITAGGLGRGVVQSSATGVFSSSEGTDGQVLISSSAGAPAWSTITAGTNVTIDNAANSVTINSTTASGANIWQVRSFSADSTSDFAKDIAYDGAQYYGAVATDPGNSSKVLYTDDLTDRWIIGSQISPSTRHECITYGGGLWVAGGWNGYISYAADITAGWTASTIGANDVRAVTYGGGFFVAATDAGKAYYTADPTSGWTISSLATTSCNGVAYGGGYWTVVGAGGQVHYTNNLAGAWSSGSIAASPNDVYGITYGNGVWVAVGNTGRVYYSATNPPASFDTVQIELPQATTTDTFASIFYDVTYGNGLFVFCGSPGMIYSTDDPSKVWNKNLLGDSFTPYRGVVYDGSQFISVGFGKFATFTP